jgi:predicted TIM-barrel fold metal-dependent hydrolase
MVTEGVFEKFPTLKVVLYEAGVFWLAPLAWRLDKNWKALRAETPWTREPPSSYIRQHFRLTSYPLEAAPDPAQLARALRLIEAERTLLFSGNFPSWELGDPFDMVAAVPEAIRARVMGENALELYGPRLMAPNR